MWRAPLVLAAVAAAAAALSPPLGACALVIAAAAAIVARDRVRRLAWCAAALAAAATLARGALPLPLSGGDELAPARDALIRPLRSLVPEPEGGLATAMLLGDRRGIPRELTDAFARTGTAHLLAISGFNMTLAAGCVAAVLKRRAPPPVVAGAALASVALYAAIVGPQPSVARAALMASIAAVALGLGRAPLSANALAAAIAVMVALDPPTLASLSFQLSVTATAGLLALQQPLSGALRSLPGPVREGLATTLAASAFTMPLVAAAFGRISLIAPLANLFAVPIFAPLLLATALTSAVGALSLELARPLAVATWALAAALRAVVNAAAAVPAASVDVPRDLAGGAVALAVIAAVALAWRAARTHAPVLLRAVPRGRPSLPRVRLGRRPVIALALAAACVAATVVVSSPAPAVRIRALDVGQGDAFLVEADGAVALVDGGPDAKRLIARLGAALPPWQRRIDLVVLTHAHLDHGAGLLELFDRYEVALAVEPRGIEPVPLTAQWHARVARAGVPLRQLGAGDRIRLGGATIEVLAPNEDPRVDVRCLVLRLVRGGFTALFTADATDVALADLLLAPARLAATVYVPPHHGANTPHAVALVDAVRPRVAVLSVGATNRYGHPAPSTMAALERIPTYRTDRDGTVEVALDGTQLIVRTRAGAVPLDRRGSVPRAPPAR